MNLLLNAIYSEDFELFQKSLGKPSLSQLSTDGLTILSEALNCSEGFFKKITPLLDCNLNNLDGTTPLSLAVMDDDLNKIKVLVDNGANINAENEELDSSLHRAIRHGNFKALELLLIDHYEKKINKCDYIGMTPLMTAAFYSQIECVKLLLAKGAKVNQQNIGNGETALHIVAQYKNKDLYTVLINSGGDENLEDDQGFTAKYRSMNGPFLSPPEVNT